jgi:hypothetical protein
MTNPITELTQQITDAATSDRIAAARADLEAAGYVVVPAAKVRTLRAHLSDGIEAANDRLAEQMRECADVCGSEGELLVSVRVIAE